jgi:hypothetical protein
MPTDRASLQPPDFLKKKDASSKRCSRPIRDKERLVSNRRVSLIPSPLAPANFASLPAAAIAPPTAARTKLMLDGPTLLRLAAPNVLNLLALAGVITFDGFFLGRIGSNALAGASLAFPWVMLVLQTTNGGMGSGISSAVARALGAAPTISSSMPCCWQLR